MRDPQSPGGTLGRPLFRTEPTPHARDPFEGSPGRRRRRVALCGLGGRPGHGRGRGTSVGRGGASGTVPGGRCAGRLHTESGEAGRRRAPGALVGPTDRHADEPVPGGGRALRRHPDRPPVHGDRLRGLGGVPRRAHRPQGPLGRARTPGARTAGAVRRRSGHARRGPGGAGRRHGGLHARARQFHGRVRLRGRRGRRHRPGFGEPRDRPQSGPRTRPHDAGGRHGRFDEREPEPSVQHRLDHRGRQALHDHGVPLRVRGPLPHGSAGSPARRRRGRAAWLGDADNDGVRVLRETLPIVAGYRDKR